MTFKITHPWNRDPFFIRNTILLFFTSGLGTKLIFYLMFMFSLYINITFLFFDLIRLIALDNRRTAFAAC